jgi:benzoyl-CoA reductase subunit BamC
LTVAVGGNKKKIVKTIKVDLDKCNGCRACEVICSAFHAVPRYGINNPARSRVRLIHQPVKDIYLPVFAGEYTAAECTGRLKYAEGGKEYRECDFCRASCPSRDLFREPDSELSLTCDMCESDPPLEKPMCVQWCLNDALVYEEREEEVDDQVKPAEVEQGVEALVNKYGLERVIDTVARLASQNAKNADGR